MDKPVTRRQIDLFLGSLGGVKSPARLSISKSTSRRNRHGFMKPCLTPNSSRLSPRTQPKFNPSRRGIQTVWRAHPRPEYRTGAEPPGDQVHADANGVCSIPIAIASQVAQASAEFVAAESVVIDFARTGNRDAKGYSKARRET